MLVDLSSYLDNKNINHRIICYQCTIDLSAYSQNRIEITRLPKCNNPFCRIRQLNKYIRGKSESVRGKLLVVGLQAILHVGIANLNNYGALIIDPPSLFSPPEGGYKSPLIKVRTAFSNILIKRSLHKAAWSSVMTEYIQEEINNLYGINPIINRPGIAASVKRSAANEYVRSQPFRIFSVSRVEKNKRIDMVLKALESIADNPSGLLYGRPWIFDIAGIGGDLNRIMNIVREKGWQEKVLFHGHVNEEELNRLFSTAHLFVMPARQGYGLPALEALAQGLPVLLHSESGVSEVLARTPWVEVVSDDDFTSGLERMIGRIINGTIMPATKPEIPTAGTWARTICQRSDWEK